MGDPAFVVAIAANEGRADGGAPGRIDFRHEGILIESRSH
jgi:hypothetical protein